jgi:hypothetical protein
MRKIGLVLAIVASTAAIGTATASATSISLLDLVKQNSAANSCRNLGGTPDLLWPGVDCEYVANLNIPRQILAGALCGALGWQLAIEATLPHYGEYICAPVIE